MDGKFLTKETEDLVVKFIYGLIVEKVPFFLRFVLKKIIAIALSFIGKYADKVVPDKLDSLINVSIVNLFNKEYDAAAASIGAAESLVINIPGVDKDSLSKALIGQTEVLIHAIKYQVEKRSNR